MNALKKIIAPCLFVCFYFAAAAQPNADSNLTNISFLNDSAFLSNCLVFIDSNNNILPANIRQQQWKPFTHYHITRFVPWQWITKRVYLKFSLISTADTSIRVYFFPGISFSNICIYKMQANDVLKQIGDLSKSDGYQPIDISAGEKSEFIAALKFTKSRFNILKPQLVSETYLPKYQKIQQYKNDPQMIVGYLLSGIILMMPFFSGANFLLNRKKEFLYNSLYTGCMFCLIFFSNYFLGKSGIAYSVFISFLSFALLAVGTAFYIAFTRKFLGTKKNYPLLNKIFVAEEMAIILLLGFYAFFHFFTNTYVFQSIAENVMKITALATGIIYIVVGVLQKDKLMNYLAIGNAFLIFFSLMSFYYIIFPVPKGGIFSNALFYYEMGIVSELVFFLVGLTYKNRIELIEKIKEQETLKLKDEKQILENKLAILAVKQNERNRISADMHDDLGAGVTAIRLYSELAKTRLGKDVVPEIEKISSSANELLNNMNAIIWTMSSSNDSLSNMVAYIRSYAQEYFENTGVNCKISIDENLPNIPVTGEIRRNIFLVIKESLNNILKHAKATEVVITLTMVPNGLSLFIQDNGVGIDFANLRRFSNGLKNMKRRMEEMNIDFLIENNNGTLVTLHYSVVL